MKSVKLAVWIFLLWFSQRLFSGIFEIKGIYPELLFVFSLCYAFLERKTEYSIWVAVACGLLAEVMSGVGISLLIYTISVLILILCMNYIYRDIPLLIIPVTLMLTFFKESMYYLFNRPLSDSIGFADALKSVVFPVMVYNAATSVFIKKILMCTVFSKNKKRR